MSQSPRLIFDLTTSSRWSGPPSGIVRTERQLAIFAKEVVSTSVEYSIYDLESKSFFVLKPDIVRRILAGNLVVEFGAGVPERILRQVRKYSFLRQPRKYLLEQYYRVANWLGTNKYEYHFPRPANTISLRDATSSRLEINSSDILVSCGADWHGKDLQAIRAEKIKTGFTYISICYDVIPWKSPQFWPEGVADSVVAYYGELAWLADRVFCISKATAQEYRQLCDAFDIPCPALSVFRLGETDFASVQADKLGSAAATLPAKLQGTRYVLMVASIEPRKNHWLLYQVWQNLVSEGRIDADVKLVFVGTGHWLTGDLMHQIRNNPLVCDRIEIISAVSDEELSLCYENCLLTVFPSFDEGWGLPVAESLMHGKVCLASNRGSLPEISTHTVLIDPLDVYAWRDAIQEYVNDDVVRSEKEKAIRQSYVGTSWKQSASQFFATAITR